MAKSTIKGLTVEIGGDTTKLGKALDKVEKQSRDLSGELGQINRLLKMDPGNTELLAQKQRVLADAVSSTKEKLDTLKEAERQVQEQFERGEVSEAQYRELQREIITTTKKLEGYEKAVEETEDALNGIGRESNDAAEGIEDTGDAAEDAEEQSDRFGDTLQTVVVGGLAGVAAAAAGAVAGLKSVVEETHEYRTAMGKLETAFEDNEHSAEAAYETYAELQGILGETDQAVEASNFLAKLCDTEEELAEWTKIAAGVYGTFGDALPIEGLTEAANETAKTGQVTGGLADALNWAADEGETFGVTLKEATEENEEWNKAVEEAVTAEDKFNLALQQCSNEQERQQLITKTLTEYYSKAADQYKETNKEVIAQNKATEKLNAAWAKVGKKAAPIVTTFQEGVAELAEAFFELVEDVDIEPFLKTIQDGFKKVSTDVLPKLIDALEWCVENFELIKSVAVGFIAALAVNKVLNFANTVKTNLKNALDSAKKSGDGLLKTLATKNWMSLASVITGVVVGAIGYYIAKAKEAEEATRLANEKIYGLTEAEKQLAERANEAAEAFRNQRASLDQNVGAITAQWGHYESLKNELLKLADAQGKVAEKDQARVQFILNELNEAMGTEYQLVGGQIQNYKDLAASIEDVMLKKKTELLLNANQESYVAATQSKIKAEDEYYSSLKAYTDAYIEQQGLKIALEKAEEERANETNYWAMRYHTDRIQELREKLGVTEETLGKTETAYNNNREALEGYYTDIGQYETAQRLMLEGNTAEAEKVLADRGYYMKTYADKVGFESESVMNTWELEAKSASVQSDHIKHNWTKGVEGYTEPMVTEAEKNYDAAVKAMEGAYNDAYGVGEDVTGGLEDGMESGRSTVVGRLKSIMQAAMSAARQTAQIKSPSRKMREIGEYMGEGLELGLDDTSDLIEGAAEDQVQRILSAYDNIRSLDGTMTLEAITGKNDAARMEREQAQATQTVSKLDLILEAIRNGQILTIDGDALVGATADKYDNQLGQRKTLAARGAI